MIIGLAGQLGSGKDTVSAYLIKQHGFERRAFTDSLKKSVAALFDIPFSDVDKLKNDKTSVVHLYMGSVYPPAKLAGKGMTFSEFLQRYGTEAHRGVFGDDFWVDQVLSKDAYYTNRKIVISDVRFKSEAQRINELGGYVVQIVRGEQVTDDSQHESEIIDFQPDALLSNNNTIDTLYEAIEEMLTELVEDAA